MRPLPFTALLLLLATSLYAQSPTEVDVNAMLKGLQAIKQTQTDSAKAALAQTIGDFTAAAASDDAAVAFYIEAVRVTQFVGQQREQTAFHDWKKREIPKLNGDAIRTCLRYTTLSLQRAAGATDHQIYPVLLAYAQDTALLLPTIADQEIVQQSVSDNIFARWYNIAGQLGGLDKWESSPANLEGIYKKVLLPIMRKNHDPAILQYWDQKLVDETTRASNAAAAFNTDTFNSNRRPELLWSRAEDQVNIGMRAAGLTAMYSIVKQFPSHPDAAKWIDELQGLLTNPTSIPADADAAAPAPSASP